MSATPVHSPDGAPLRDGRSMPWVGFGTYLSTHDEVVSSCTDALQLGYHAIDTAEGYQTEGAVGVALRKHSEAQVANSDAAKEMRPFVTTKLWPGGLGSEAKSFAAVVESLESSLDKLGLPCVDLYLVHAPFAGPPATADNGAGGAASGDSSCRLDQWRALIHLKSIGKCTSIGVSNYSVRHLEEIRSAGLEMPACNQLELHPLCQHRDIVAYCRENGVLPVAYSSLAPLGCWRVGQRSRKTREQEKAGEEGGECTAAQKASEAEAVISSIASKYTFPALTSGDVEGVGGGGGSVSPAHLLLLWALQHGYPILPKSTHRGRIAGNVHVFRQHVAGFVLSEEDMASLDALDAGQSFAWPDGDPCDHL